jgi:hypothetical protein
MAVIDPKTSYAGKAFYWFMVEHALSDVFRVSRDLHKDLRLEMDNASPEEQLLFYHAEPLDVAADLAGQRPPTGAQVVAYRNVARQRKWP